MTMSSTADQAHTRTKAVRDAFVSGAGAKVGSLAAQLLALGVAARTLDVTHLGILVTLTAVSGILGFLDFGIGNASISEFARLHAGERVTELRKAVTTALGALTTLGAVLCVLIAIVAIVAPHSETEPAFVAFGLLSACALPGSLGARIALGCQNGRQNNLVMIASSIAVLLAAGVAGLVHAGLLAHVVIFIGFPVVANALQTVWQLRQHVPLWRDLDVRSMRTLLRRGIPFGGLALAGAVAYQTDSVIIVAVLGSAAAVGFGMLTRIFTGLTVLFMGGLQQLWASTAHALAVGDLPWVRRTFWRAFVITMALYVLADLVLLVLAPTIITVWSNGQAGVTVGLVAVFVVWNTYSFSMSQFSMLLNGAGVVGRQAALVLTMAAANLPLSLFFTGVWGEVGPLVGSFVSHLFVVGVPLTVWALRLLKSGVATDGEHAAAETSTPLRAKKEADVGPSQRFSDGASGKVLSVGADAGG